MKDKSAIDIGTREAMIPILLKKMGARNVVAYDRIDLSNKIEYVKYVHDVSFDYVSNIQLRELPSRLEENGQRYFDLVVFSGVLYHMIDPLGLLALVRGMCQVGGLLLIETAAIHDAEEKLVFNAEGKVYGPHGTYFCCTTSWLDYALRMLSLRPLYAVYQGNLNRRDVARVAILCRSEPQPCPRNGDDTWISKPFHDRIFGAESQIDWETLRKTKSAVTCEPYDEKVLSLDSQCLYPHLAQVSPYEPSDVELKLSLASTM